MTLSNDIYTVMAADSGVSALVGDRITTGRLNRDDTYPQIQIVTPADFDDSMYRDHDGAPGRADVVIQFDCYGVTAVEAENVADAIIDLWSGYQSSSPDFGSAFIERKLDDGYNGGLNAYRYIVSVAVNISV